MNQKTKRILMSLIGTIILAFSIGIFKFAALGVDPFQALMGGLDLLIPISFGTLYVIVNGILLIFSLLFDRSKIGIATFINLFLLGYIADFTLGSLGRILPAPSLLLRLLLMALAILIICFAISLYMTADLGVSTYDAIAIILAEKWKLTKFQYCRIITDIVCVILGVLVFFLAGGTLATISTIVGIGTIITAFFMGPLINFFNEKISVPLLEKERKS
ncbi:MAG: hypothetical protein IJZ00_01125 [Lachnospiraceae bacterium]|nr:hypothetical protein [Lachnospiraceae bacterium]